MAEPVSQQAGDTGELAPLQITLQPAAFFEAVNVTSSRADLPRADPSSDAPVKPRDVFVYFIHEGKIRAPQAAQALMERVAR